MEKPVGIKEIAKLSNTSIGTVDRVINNRTGVAPKTKQRILEVIKQTGYVKNNIASRLKLSAGKKVNIAVVLPHAISGVSYWNLPKNGIKKALSELSDFGVEVDFMDFSSDDKFRYNTIVNKIINHHYDGIITVSLFEEISKRLVDFSNKNDKPLIFIDSKNNAVTKANFVCQNSIKAGEVAARLLYNNIGNNGVYIALTLVDKSEFQGNQKERELGFKNFLQSKNKEIKIHSIVHTIDENLEHNLELQKLMNVEMIKGVFVTNSRSYIFAKFLKEKTYKNVQIIGFDLNQKNIEELKNESIQYLINQKPELQGYQSLMKIFQKITQDDTVSLNIDIPIEIIVKENLQDSNEIL
ncbi:LacI family DNA-binding transcriptional regulator [Wenyingzhuangia sp. chi5]|uniref:LacI family DNA-binding transcriptional regulator n=1 Tax=Wenyingzhuangia gilva TaxID=3057677 RepID=A0ABT8VT79_9FLAO|nr:LacI family DNA-binding transcriptional regulator [Wenyingzhuangia sp. chi5]MDO3695171.1 LacI family DNA-binding transcriptional regulator [Wenyingzhuangia sp. chi5]